MCLRKDFRVLALVLILCLLSGCTPAASLKAAGTPYAFAADYLGVYYITQEKTVCFIPFSEDKAAESGHEIGIMSGLSDITAICAEVDGYIGAIDSAGRYHTTCDIQPEHAEDFIPTPDSPFAVVGAGHGQVAATAQGFAGLSDVSFFRSSYPLWGLFVHNDGSVTIPGFYEEKQKIYDSWTNVTQLAGSNDVIALTSDGTILCMPDSPYKDKYESWNGISALYSNYSAGVFAVTKEGDVLYTGENRWGEGDVGDWHNIASIAVDRTFTVGLRTDGTVVAAGVNNDGQCNVSDWIDIIAVAVSNSMGIDGVTAYTAGLDRSGNLWISGKIQGVSYSGIYMEGAAPDYVQEAVS